MMSMRTNMCEAQRFEHHHEIDSELSINGVWPLQF